MFEAKRDINTNKNNNNSHACNNNNNSAHASIESTLVLWPIISTIYMLQFAAAHREDFNKEHER